MLNSLYIQNSALIEKLDINFQKGFSVITGETGAGKSIMLGAIGLLLGQRADTKSIRQGASKCIIEARFQVGNYKMEPFFENNHLEFEDECIVRREIQASGKSRAFINDTPVSLSQMKELGEQLIDVHSQHQNLLLNTEGFQLNVLDILAHNDQLLSKYQSVYTQLKQIEGELKEAIAQSKKSQENEDYIRFQYEQLENANLIDGEQDTLEQEAETLTYAEDIKANLYRIEQLFSADEGGLLSAIKEATQILSNLQKIYSPAAELTERMHSSYIELKDIVDEVSLKGENIEFNPAKLDEINERLNLIYSLQQKHRVQTIEELIQIADEYAKQLDSITSYEDRIIELTRQQEDLLKQVAVEAEVLTQSRKDAAAITEKEMAKRLMTLGMPNVRFQIEIGKRNEFGLYGQDTVTFLFSANKNGSLQNISAVASGGEIARVMLSL